MSELLDLVVSGVIGRKVNLHPLEHLGEEYMILPLPGLYRDVELRSRIDALTMRGRAV
jgi:hypothetical protein